MQSQHTYNRCTHQRSVRIRTGPRPEPVVGRTAVTKRCRHPTARQRVVRAHADMKTQTRAAPTAIAVCRAELRWFTCGSSAAQAPNQRARRLEPKCSFSATRAADGALKLPVLAGAGEEVDVHAPDASAAELDVAGAAAVVGAGPLAVAELGDQLSRDDARGALGEHARLRHAGRRRRRRPRRRRGSASAAWPSRPGT